MQKILVIRFSSIGDIVLTSPVIRCIKQQLVHVELHFVTKEIFRPVLANNPYIDKLHSFKKDVSELYSVLAEEKYDFVVDLHKNLRSLRLKQKLNVKSYSFNKLNLKKFLAVNFKMKNVLPPVHIVERYFETVKELGIKSDGKGLDYYLNESEKINVTDFFFAGKATKFIALAIGGSYYTKKIPLAKLQEICLAAKLPLLLLGGKEDAALGEDLQKSFPAEPSHDGQ